MSEGSPEPQAADAAVLRLRGLPFQATEEEVVEFFEDVQLEQVVLCRRNGRATGEAYVQLGNPEDMPEALKLNKKYVGRRYIELFEASLSDLATVKVLSEENRGYVIRLRGLPYSSKPSNIISFLGPVEVLGNEDGVVFTYQADGRPTGEAYVELPSEDAAQQAMKKHKQTLGSRYVEVFTATKADFLQAQQQIRLGPVLAGGRRRYLPQHLQLAGQAGLAAGAAAAAAAGSRYPGMPFSNTGAVEEVTDQFFRGFNVNQRPPGPRPPGATPGGSASQVPYMQYPPESSEQQPRQQQAGGSSSLVRPPSGQMLDQSQMFMQQQYMMQSQLMHNQQMQHGMRFDQAGWGGAMPPGAMGPGMPVQAGAPGMRPSWPGFKAFGSAAAAGPAGWGANPMAASMFNPSMAYPMGMNPIGAQYMEQQQQQAAAAAQAQRSGPGSHPQGLPRAGHGPARARQADRPALPAAEELDTAATSASHS